VGRMTAAQVAKSVFCSSMYAPADEGAPLQEADLSPFATTDLAKLLENSSKMVPSGVATQLSMSDPVQSAAFHSDRGLIVVGMKGVASHDAMKMAVLIYLHEIGHSLQFTRAASKVALLEFRSSGAAKEKAFEAHADMLGGFLLFHLIESLYKEMEPENEMALSIQDREMTGQIFFYDQEATSSPAITSLFPPVPQYLEEDGKFDEYFISYRFIGGKKGRGNTHPSQAERMEYLKRGFREAFYGVGGVAFFEGTAQELEIWAGFT